MDLLNRWNEWRKNKFEKEAMGRKINDEDENEQLGY